MIWMIIASKPWLICGNYEKHILLALFVVKQWFIFKKYNDTSVPLKTFSFLEQK